VQQGDPAAAEADGLDRVEPEMTKQLLDVIRGLAE